MKCVFKDSNCIKSGGHDDCRNCRNVPEMELPEDPIEFRVLCSIAGKRDKLKAEYGSVLSKVPQWVKTLSKRNNGMGDGIPCTDHRRYLGEKVINEPYNISMDEVKDLIIYCESNNLTFRIDGDSAHLPGRCIRIIMSKKD